jgi:1-acyl-sn-glycerol-3-phosphate acyltransferase
MRSRLYPVASILVFAILYSYTAIGVIIVLAMAELRMKNAIAKIIQLWAKSVFLIMGKRFPVYGKENLNKGRRYILVANHGSLFDIVAIVSFYPNISWFGRERLLKIPLFGRILKMTDYVPFKEPTYKNTKNMIEQLTAKADQKTIAIFPEGTRTLDGKINTFYRGFIYLLRTKELEILPVTLNGFYRLKPKKRSYIDFSSRLNVVIHKPIDRETLLEKNDNEIVNTVRSVIESAYEFN